MPHFDLENRFSCPVIGIDEAGRGPWAGPVVAGAALLQRDRVCPDFLSRLDDSKKLSAAVREDLFQKVHSCALVGVGIATVDEIDQLNILQATFLAMRRALEQLVRQMPDPACHVLIDGNRLPPWARTLSAETVVRGDSQSYSIAAASIIAKVTRDQMMQDLGRQFPHYGWGRNAGYGTQQHQQALAEHGVTPHHRRSFAPIRRLLQDPEAV